MVDGRETETMDVVDVDSVSVALSVKTRRIGLQIPGHGAFAFDSTLAKQIVAEFIRHLQTLDRYEPPGPTAPTLTKQ